MDGGKVLCTLDITLNAERFDEFERIALALTAHAQKEPGLLEYEWCLSKDRRQCRLLESYVDGDALLAHLNSAVVQSLVPKLLEISVFSVFEVFGDPGAKAAKMLAGFGAQIFTLWHGVTR